MLPSPTIPARLALLLAMAIPACSCSSMRVPAARPSLPGLPAFHATEAGLEMRFRPIDSAEAYREMFDEDLPAFGVVAVWAEVANSGDSDADLREAEWEVRTASRARLRRIAGQKVLEHYHEGRKTRIYTQHAHEKALEALERLSFGIGSIAPRGKAEGLLFFGSRGAVAPGWSREAKLLVRKMRIRERRLTIEVPFHAISP